MITSRGPVALVTGAGHGIGRVIGRRLAQAGMNVAVHYWDGEASALALADAIRDLGREALVIRGDLTVAEVPQSIVQETLGAFSRIDVVVNNAGVTFRTPFLDLALDEVEACYRINYRAPLLVSQAAARWMVDHHHPGNIVHITSVHQERTTDRDNVYGAMKAALARLTESMAYEFAPYGIRVNAVEPGRIATEEQRGTLPQEWERAIDEAIPLRRSGTSEDVAEAVAWLSSPEAGYVTGITLRVDGGMNLPMTRAPWEEQLHFFLDGR